MKLADAVVEFPTPLAPADAAELRAHFSPGQVAEIALGLGLFHGLAKALIVLGLEPTDMPVTVMPEPGSQSAA